MSWLSYSSLIPPNLFILLAALGLVIACWKRRLGLALATAAVGCLYLASTPVVAYLLVRSSEAFLDTIPTLPSDSPPGAIIVLAADARRGDPRRTGYHRPAHARAPRRSCETAAASRIAYSRERWRPERSQNYPSRVDGPGVSGGFRPPGAMAGRAFAKHLRECVIFRSDPSSRRNRLRLCRGPSVGHGSNPLVFLSRWAIP